MEIDIDLFLEILGIDSTSASERPLADFLARALPADGCTLQRFPDNAGPADPVNLLLSWGKPRVVFCTHLDTVPPYIPPSVSPLGDDDMIVHGRGACDAKGQIIAMYTACRELARQGHDGFGLLLLFGEETGSFGAKQFCQYPGADYVIVGEPTDNRMVSASKGTKCFEVTISGVPFHSGYPDHGTSAIDLFVDMVHRIRDHAFALDPVLGATTFNVGRLVSDNPQNVLSPLLTCRIYFRTTFASDAEVSRFMLSLASDCIDIKPLGGDSPMRYTVLTGFETTTVAFGSDAPQLHNFNHKLLCGPGSILVAHRDDEQIKLSDLCTAADIYVRIFHKLAIN